MTRFSLTPFVLALAFSFGISQSHADSHAEGMSGEDMFTQCGIGAMIFPDKPVLAVISNVTWDSGTTAVSSGLSDAGCSGSKMEAASLIYQKYSAIEVETASGSGEHLSALMDIYGCNSESQKVVLLDTRQDFAKVVSQSTYSSLERLEKAKVYFEIVDGNANSSCAI